MVTEFVKICTEDEIEEGKAKSFEINNEPVILARLNSKIYAVEGVCSHDGGKFGEEQNLVEGQLECPRHGARFDITTGEAIRLPAVVGVKKYDVKIENGDILAAIEK